MSKNELARMLIALIRLGPAARADRTRETSGEIGYNESVAGGPGLARPWAYSGPVGEASLSVEPGGPARHSEGTDHVRRAARCSIPRLLGFAIDA
jgi:hypothetical protein